MHLSVFNFNGAEVRTIIKDGEPWWVARDVFAILELADGRTSVERLDEDERHSMPVADSLGRDQDMTVINESGLYSLILRSRKAEAKVFKKWVTSEVLPAIRKTGAYLPTRDPVTEVDRLAGVVGQLLPALTGRIVEVTSRQEVMDGRLTLVEEKQRTTDPLAIERRMRYLDTCKNLLVFGTKGKPQAITFRSFWCDLKALIGINSFTNRAALTVPMMDRCVAYAREWCETRGVTPPEAPEEMAA